MNISDADLKKVLENQLFLGVDRNCAIRNFKDFDCKIICFRDGEILHNPESKEKTAGIILYGKASVSTPNASKKTLLRILGAGSPYGIANLFSDAPYVSVIRARGDCRAFIIPEAAVRRLLSEDSSFLYRYLAFMSDRIRYLNQKIGYLTAGSTEKRLALYLASFGKEEIQLDISISTLSDLLDVGRASLYRAFDQLTQDGFICKDGRCFTLTNIKGMLSAYR